MTMNRNTISHFALAPQVSIPRSRFKLNHGTKTSFNFGDLIPIAAPLEVYPGDTIEMKTSKVLRLQTLMTPVMDTAYCDIFHFFVPARLCWSHFQNLMGENGDSEWIPEVEYSAPQLTAPSGGWNVGTLADYFGIPVGVDDLSVSALPFRAYGLIVDQWFRSEVTQQPLSIPIGDSDVVGVNTGNYVTDCVKGGLPFVANKLHDFFTSCTPSPQKGIDVPLPLGETAPVVTSVDAIDTSYFSGYPLKFAKVDGTPLASGVNWSTGIMSGGLVLDNHPSGFADQGSLQPSNLWADLSVATASSVNALRTAFQIQRMFEKDAMGSRYTELLRSHFGVTSPDARLQRSEFLGGNRFPLNISQVLNMSANDGTGTVDPLGATGAYSLTADVHYDFTKSFVEHGYVISLACCRYVHSYQNSLARLWSRKTRFDFFWPALSHIGNRAVLNKELYADGTSTDDEVFGYQEAWAELRTIPSIITGQMRSAASTSLDTWHFADDYSSLPYLSSDWLQEDKSNVDRTLRVESSDANQIFGDFWFECRGVRCLDAYSIPGLIDHF